MSVPQAWGLQGGGQGGGGGGSGEANTSSNLGTGAQIAAAKSGVNLPFRTILGGTMMTASQGANDVTLDFTPSKLGVTTSWSDGTQAALRWTFNLSGSSDPSILFGDSLISISGGDLAVGANAVSNRKIKIDTDGAADCVLDAVQGILDVTGCALKEGGVDVVTTADTATESVNGIVKLSEDGGTTAGEVVQASDSRLTPCTDHNACLTSGSRADEISHPQYDYVQTGTGEPNGNVSCPANRQGKAIYRRSFTVGSTPVYATYTCTTTNSTVWQLTSARTVTIPLVTSSWISGKCIGFATGDMLDCDAPGAELAVANASVVLDMTVVHRGIALPAGNVCDIQLLVKAPATTGAGTQSGSSLVYGDSASNDPGEIATPIALNAGVTAGGSVQFKIVNNGTNSCSQANAAIVARIQ